MDTNPARIARAARVNATRMETSTSRVNKHRPNVVDIVLNTPRVTDEPGTGDLRALCRVNRDIHNAVGHPAVWRCQLGKSVGARPRNLSDSGMYAVVPPNPSKALYQSVDATPRVALEGRFASCLERAMPGAVYGYLQEHSPEFAAKLDKTTRHTALLEDDGSSPKYFWEDLAFDAGYTSVNVRLSAVFSHNLSAVPAQVTKPATMTIANFVKLLGAKSAKAYLLCTYGIGLAGSLTGVELGVYLTADTIIWAKRHYDSRKRQMQELRIRDLVAEYGRLQ
jgi:hypothetical protein